MQACTLLYIPKRLHSNDRLSIKEFEVGEYLYRRCTKEELSNPFKTISLTELSHNRGGWKSQILCNPDDVLYSILESEHFEKYVDKVICTLVIKSLTDDSKYIKQFSQTKDGKEYIGKIELLHEPEVCMYPHSVFRIWVNGEKITYDNYKETLKKLNEIRNQIKEELAAMIWTKEIHQEKIDGNNN